MKKDDDATNEEQRGEDDDDLFVFPFFDDDDDDEEKSNDEKSAEIRSTEQANLPSTTLNRSNMMQIGSGTAPADWKQSFIASHMGSMAQCRGRAGENLRRLGAVDALLTCLDYELLQWEKHRRHWGELVIACLGALRDLACGSAANRTAIRKFRRKRHDCEVCAPTMEGEKDKMLNVGNAIDIDAEQEEVCEHVAARDTKNSENNGEDYLENNKMNGSGHDDYDDENDVDVDNSDHDANCDCDDEPHEDGDGLSILTRYLHRYHGVSWTAILHQQCSSPPGDGDASTTSSKLKSSSYDLRLLTQVVATLRNITHSSVANSFLLCQRYKIVPLLKWRLLHGDKQKDSDDGDDMCGMQVQLPPPGCPWREACFRIAGTLINMSEKCPACAWECATGTPTDNHSNTSLSHTHDRRETINSPLCSLLVQTWQSTSVSSRRSTARATRTLHLGLFAILQVAVKLHQENASTSTSHSEKEMVASFRIILQQEEKRRLTAQRREEERKRKRKKQQQHDKQQ